MYTTVADGLIVLSDAVLFGTRGGSDRMKLDSSGNLGVNISSPLAKLDIKGDTSTYATMAKIYLTDSNANAASRNWSIGNGGTGYGYLTFSVSAAKDGNAGDATSLPRMVIDSNGNLLVGTTTAPTFNGGATNFGVKGGIGFTGNSASTYYYTIQSNTTDFYIGTTNLSRYAALVGISTFTAWSFGSDRRIKHDIEDVKYGLAEVLAMQPRQYKLNDGNQFSIGFIAQELKEVVPEAVTGKEIEFSDNDTDQERAKKTMGVSKDLLIPVLVKAIQEQQALITQLQADVAALLSLIHI
jgi:hypothetical protein